MDAADPVEPQDFVTEVLAQDVTWRAQLVHTPAGRLALVRNGDRLVAVEAWCPHLDGPLWEGSVADDEIACPWHGWRYSLTSGACTWAPRGDAEEAAETEIAVHAASEGQDGHVVIHLGRAPGA